MALSPVGPAGDAAKAIASGLPMFDGFPYLVTRMVPTMYHVTLLPRAVGDLELALPARAQWRANRLDCCLVLGEQRALYIWADGFERLVTVPPRSNFVVSGNLKVSSAWSYTPEMRARQRRLDVFIDQYSPKKGYSFGDLSKGGRDATADEVARLAGAGPAGAPRGLERCSVCQEWRGVCLDPAPRFFCKVMHVHCRCCDIGSWGVPGGRCPLDLRRDDPGCAAPRQLTIL